MAHKIIRGLNLGNSEPLPKWMMRKYAQAWQHKKDKAFTMDELVVVLKEDKKILNVLVSNLRKKGWLTVELDEEDARKRIYQLKNPETIVEVMS